MCAQRPPEPAREPGGQDARKARYVGCVSFGDFSLHKQRKVTRSPVGRVEALHFEKQEGKELDSGFRRNDEQFALPVRPSGRSRNHKRKRRM